MSDDDPDDEDLEIDEDEDLWDVMTENGETDDDDDEDDEEREEFMARVPAPGDPSLVIHATSALR